MGWQNGLQSEFYYHVPCNPAEYNFLHQYDNN